MAQALRLLWPRPIAGLDPSAFEARLASVWEQARAAWPRIELTPQRFIAHLAAHVEGEVLAALEAVQASDLYLACACADADPSAFEAFDQQHLKKTGLYVGHLDRSAAFVDEVRQALRERLLVPRNGQPPRIATYSGRVPLAAWVRVSAVRIALNLKRGKKASAMADAAPSATPPVGADPAIDYLKARYRGLFNEAFQAALNGLADDDRTLLQMYYLDELSVDELAKVFQIHRSTAARRVEKVRQRLTDSTREFITARLKVSASELESLMRVMRSQLEVSLKTQLAPPEGT